MKPMATSRKIRMLAYRRVLSSPRLDSVKTEHIDHLNEGGTGIRPFGRSRTAGCDRLEPVTTHERRGVPLNRHKPLPVPERIKHAKTSAGGSAVADMGGSEPGNLLKERAMPEMTSV